MQPARKRRAAKPARKPRLAEAIKELICALRRQAGVHVRLPSHHQAPYRASQWQFVDAFTAPATSGIGLASPPSILNIAFTGEGATTAGLPGPALPEAFPEGHLGVVSWVQFFVTAALNNVVDPGIDFRVSILKNELPVPGWERTRPGGALGMVVAAAGGPFVVPGCPLLVPIHLAPGDVLQLRIENSSAAGVTFTAGIAGWMYPAHAAEPSIFGTIVD